MQEQQRRKNNNRKGGHITGSGAPCPAISIHVLSSQSSASTTIQASDNLQTLQSPIPLEILAPRDEAAKEDGDWQVSNVTDDAPKLTMALTLSRSLIIKIRETHKDWYSIAPRFVKDVRR